MTALLRRVRRVMATRWVRLRCGVGETGPGSFLAASVSVRRGCLRRVGAWSFVGPWCRIGAPTELGNWVLLAAHVRIVGGDHRTDVVGTPVVWAGRDDIRPVVIADDVWIGTGAIILHGVHIGEGALVGAGAVVTVDVPPYTVVAGVPARVVRQRFNAEGVAGHRRALAELRRSHLHA